MQSSNPLRQRLNALLALPENKVCADCKTENPKWASANLGVFICLKCSGIHRSLGTHISFVRSVTMDVWTEQHVRTMEMRGNKKVNRFYQAKMPSDFKVPSPMDGLAVRKKFINLKYVQKKWFSKDLGESAAPSQSSQSELIQLEEEKEEEKPDSALKPERSSRSERSEKAERRKRRELRKRRRRKHRRTKSSDPSTHPAEEREKKAKTHLLNVQTSHQRTHSVEVTHTNNNLFDFFDTPTPTSETEQTSSSSSSTNLSVDDFFSHDTKIQISPTDLAQQPKSSVDKLEMALQNWDMGLGSSTKKADKAALLTPLSTNHDDDDDDADQTSSTTNDNHDPLSHPDLLSTPNQSTSSIQFTYSDSDTDEDE